MNKRSHITIIIIIVNLLAVTGRCSSQPFIDILSLQHINSPDHGLINQKKNATTLKNFFIQATVPFQFKNKTDALIFSPSFEILTAEVQTVNKNFEKLYGLALPVSYLKTLTNPDWSILSTIIIKKNGYELATKNNLQIGGAVLVNFKANENLRYKLGIYVNKEFFGMFVMPLLGIDWQISKKTNLFGLLPGNLTLEHKLHKNIYTGASFRAITNSYRLDTGYWRINENRLGIFIDCYISKNLVLNAEAGHSVFRKLSTGVKHKSKTDWNSKDNIYFKLGLAFRMRFR